MAVHPVGPGKRLEIVGPDFTADELGARHVGNAVLFIWGNLPVPMDDVLDVETILEGELETITRIENESLPPVGAGDAVDSRGPSIDLDRAGGRDEPAIGLSSFNCGR